jgi:hypothetical protein
MDFNNISEVIEYYNTTEDINKHKVIYDIFKEKVSTHMDGILKIHYDLTKLSWCELCFHYNYYLIIKDMPSTFKFLEIGVYKGRILSLIKLLSNKMNKTSEIYGITPLNGNGDKFSSYENIDYLYNIKSSFIINNLSFENVSIIKGFSQDKDIIDIGSKTAPYDIIFIDGCHDYNVVVSDITNYAPMLKKGGYLIIDDASYFVSNAYTEHTEQGKPYYGYIDVGKAIIDTLENDINFKECYVIGHNRVWKKL